MKLILILLFYIFSFPVFSQNLPKSDTQWWNDVTITKPLIKSKDSKGKEFDRFSIFFNGTLRFGNHLKTAIDERVGFGFDIKVNHFLTLTPSYLYRSNKPNLSVREYESRFRFAATLEKKFAKFSIKDRNLIEYRMRNSHADSTRYRNKFTFTVPILKDKKELFAPFVADEPYYDFSIKHWSRNEFSAGITKKFTNNFTGDFYYLRQDNRSGTPKAVNAVGMSFKIKLD
ncbi:MAG: DUF2490 domain-containing protein [Pyrinomonadaceae bacterium]|nr:DUF2490 domain-containing protein [Pyrinomonadaceae bacterium]